MPAPDTPPTTGCGGRPLPLRTSCLVLAGRSPGLEEPPLYNRVPSPCHCFLCLPHTASLILHLTFFLFYSSSLMCSLSCFLFLPFSYFFLLSSCFFISSIGFLPLPSPNLLFPALTPLTHLSDFYLFGHFIIVYITPDHRSSLQTAHQLSIPCQSPCQGCLPPPVRCCLAEATLRSVLQKNKKTPAVSFP